MRDTFCLIPTFTLYVSTSFFSMATLENTLDFKGKLIHNNINAKKKTVRGKQNF